jgi:hypothetical protein
LNQEAELFRLRRRASTLFAKYSSLTLIQCPANEICHDIQKAIPIACAANRLRLQPKKKGGKIATLLVIPQEL